MGKSVSDSHGDVNLESEAEKVGDAQELSPKDRARFNLAGRILFGVFVLLLASIALLAWGPQERLDRFEKIFDFAKTGGLSLATLVIGFYFKASLESD